MNNITKENWNRNKPQQNIESSTSPAFPSRLRNYMEDEQISVKDLAEELYLTPPTVTGYRKGRRSPDLEKFTRLVQSLHVSADYLIGESNVPHPIYGEFTSLEYEVVNELRKKSNADQYCFLELLRNVPNKER